MNIISGESIESKILKTALSLFNVKKNTLMRMKKGTGFVNPKSEHLLPGSKFFKNHHIKVSNVKECPVYTISALQTGMNLTSESQNNSKINNTHGVLYFHGGAYMASFMPFHWKMISTLTGKTKYSIIAPSYPLAPKATWREALAMAQELYISLISRFSHENLIIMGDSAGGGLALALSQLIQELSLPQPSKIILLSPWLDITMNNPLIASVEKQDPLLSIEALKTAGRLWAGGTPGNDWHVSPLYGSFKGLPPISIFTGTADILNPDAVVLKERLQKENLPVNYYEYPNMMHDWMFFNISEAKSCIKSIISLLNY